MGELNCTGKCAKTILFICNLVVVLAGLLLLGIGIWFLAAPGSVYYLQAIGTSSYNLNMVRAAGGIIIAVGIFLALVGFAGCWGAVRHLTGCLNCYSVILVLLVLLQIVAIILAGVFHTQITTGLTVSMKETLKFADNTTKTAWDFMQYEFTCCGVTNYTDWINSYWYNSSSKSDGPYVPDTCCKLLTNSTDFQHPHPENRAECNRGAEPGNPTSTDQLYAKGCEKMFEDWVNRYLGALIGVAVGVIIIEVAGVVLSCLLVARIKSGYEYV